MGLFKKKVKEEPVTELKAYMQGCIIPITQVSDEVFASKALGEGIAIEPSASASGHHTGTAGQNMRTVTAPCGGVVSMAADTGHAVGLSLNNGAELLLHIGIDTVNLNGEGFHVFVKENDRVKQGDPLLEFDQNLIAQKGYPATCILVLTNSAEYPDVKFADTAQAIQDETVICRFS